ncbi:MAG: aminotransferase class III-fold pyridoxal phosphate-dependent enzyme [Balneolales bacterium]|nr:aminotransferase class III-fold pyridoxal phosphate-dependent enzyme [Balneolales bacterium]
MEPKQNTREPYSVPYPSLVHALTAAGKSTAGIRFVRSSSSEFYVSYETLHIEASKVAACLAQKNLPPKSEILIQASDNESFVRLFWGCIAAGFIPVPLSLGFTNDHRLKLLHVWNQLNSPFLLHDAPDSYFDHLHKTAESVNSLETSKKIESLSYSLATDEIANGSPATVLASPGPDDVAFIQFSSGSTGKPKGVSITHRKLFENMAAMRRHMQFDDETFLSWIPLTHDMGLILYHMLPVVMHYEQILMPTQLFIRYPSLWMQKGHEHRATQTVSPNFGFRFFLDHYDKKMATKWDLSSFKTVLNAAEPISRKICKSFYSTMKPFGLRDGVLRSGYGLAEATLAVSMGDPNESMKFTMLNRESLATGSRVVPEGSGLDECGFEHESSDADDDLNDERSNGLYFAHCGKMLDNFEYRVTDESGTTLPDLTIGEIELKGIMVVDGYYNNPEKTQELMRDGGWLRTGDLGFFNEDELYITGRCKEIIFAGGLNYYPHDLEAVLSELDGLGLNKIAAAGTTNQNTGLEELLIFVQFKARLTSFLPLEESVRNCLMQHFGLDATHIIPVKQIPKTTSGKLQRVLLIKKYETGEFDEVLNEIYQLKTSSVDSEFITAVSENQANGSKKTKVTKTDSETDEVADKLVTILEKLTGVDTISPNTPFSDLGISSFKAVKLYEILKKEFGKDPGVSAAFDFPTPAELAAELCRLPSIDSSDSEHPSAKESGITTNTAGNLGDKVAVTGFAFRLPGDVRTVEQLWEVFCGNPIPVESYPAERPNTISWEILSNSASIPKARFLSKPADFDQQFFSMMPPEARATDPQQRILLETAFHAFELARIGLKSLKKSSTGVFIGASKGEYAVLSGETNPDSDEVPYELTGNMASTTAGRLSYFFGLHGPALTVDTACSSSLSALAQACAAIQNRQCEQALAGSSNLILDSAGMRKLTGIKALAPDGCCKTFEASADGYGRAEGVICFVLEPLARAVENGKTIFAVIDAITLNHDGRSNGLTAPNGEAQRNLIEKNLSRAGYSVSELSFLETHGTGTRLGDPQEVSAISRLAGLQERSQPLYLSASKAHFGHLESAAGMLGLLKAILMIQHKTIPAQPLSNGLNPLLSDSMKGLEIPQKKITLNKHQNGEIRGGVSSFGLSGTNAHVLISGFSNIEAILKQAVQANPFTALKLEAATQWSLNKLAERWLELARSASISDADFREMTSSTLFTEHGLDYKKYFSGQNRTELVSTLENFVRNDENNLIKQSSPKTVWLFAGQGAQRIGMMRSLYQHHPIFRDSFDECRKLLKKHGAIFDAFEILESKDERIHETEFTQPVLAACQISMARVLLEAGLKPDALSGHSLGEFPSLWLAGVLDLEDTLRLLLIRGRLMASVSGNGGMMVVFAERNFVEKKLTETGSTLEIASDNGVGIITLSGLANELKELGTQLKNENIRFKKLSVSAAFHSAMMEPVKEAFLKEASRVSFNSARIPVYLNNGTKLETGSKIDADYLWNQLRNEVQFGKSLHLLQQDEMHAAIEISPAPVLSPVAARILEYAPTDQIFSLFNGDENELKDWGKSCVSLANLFPSADLANLLNIKRQTSHALTSFCFPRYPFKRNTFWHPGIGKGQLNGGKTSPEKNTPSASLNGNHTPIVQSKSLSQEVMSSNSSSSREDAIIELFNEITGIDRERLRSGIDTNLFELGLDSLVLMKVKSSVKEKFGLEIAASQFFRELNTLAKLIDKINNEAPAPATDSFSPAETPGNQAATDNSAPASEITAQTDQNPGVIAQIVNQQLSIMQQQLDLLRGNVSSASTGGNGRMTLPAQMPSPQKKPADIKTVSEAARKEYIAYKSVRKAEGMARIPAEGLQRLVRSYTEMTASSKKEVDQYRPWLATSRNIAGFRPDRKEMVYQLQVERAEGAYVWDIDGNRLLDITMGFGVSLFGNKPGFIQEAITEEMSRGIGVGAMSYLTGKTAQKFCELTGNERVAFFNTGSEAVMNAVRIARTHTSRIKVVQFSGAYHGNTDPVLAAAGEKNGAPAAVPMSPGIPESYFDDLVVLPYGSPETLSWLKENCAEVAAVVVESVQSRKPDFRPAAFLKEVRQITQDAGTVLIFDEVITGLRLGPRGAQHFYGIKADLAAYGKIVGGGLPIGLVAGKREVMAAVDGGIWQYGDDSLPEAENTFSAGTFNHHPLVLSAMNAVLDKIKAESAEIYPRLEQLTDHLKNTLNEYFECHRYPIKVVNFGSLFRFELGGAAELLFYKLVTKGVYIWEGRNCFLSTAHTEEDVTFLIQAVIDAVEEMRQDGFFPDDDGGDSTSDLSGKDKLKSSNGISTAVKSETPLVFSQHPVQQRIFSLCSLEGGTEAYQIKGAMTVEGDLQADSFLDACRKTVLNHDAFFTRFSVENGILIQQISSKKNTEPLIHFFDYTGKPEAEIDILLHKLGQPFNTNKWPLASINLIRISAQKHLIMVNAHHIALDGISLSILFTELLQQYFGAAEKTISNSASYQNFVEWQANYEKSEAFSRHEAYWNAHLDSLPAPVIPGASMQTDERTMDGGRITKRIPTKLVKEAAQKAGVSPYCFLFGLFSVWASKLSGTEEVTIGGVVSGRPDGFEQTIGMFANTIPYRIRTVSKTETLPDFLQQLSSMILNHIDASLYPLQKLTSRFKKERTPGSNPLFELVFAYEKDDQRSVTAGGLRFSTYDLPRHAASFPLLLDIIETSDETIVGFEYQQCFYTDERASLLADSFISFVHETADLNVTTLPFSQLKLDFSEIITTESASLLTDEKSGVNSESEPENTSVSVATAGSIWPQNGHLRHALTEIWKKVLGTTEVEPDTSFFWLGGDSIKAIQMISLIADLGYHTNIRTIFKYPTVNRLATQLELQKTAEQLPDSSGHIPFLPIQKYFNSLQLENPDYWNQAIGLEIDHTITKEELFKIQQFLIARHPSLRSRLSDDGIMVMPAETPSESFTLIKETEVKHFKEGSALFEECMPLFVDLQQRFDLREGPTSGLLHIRTPERSFILWAVHHLFTDAVSWQILLGDFSALLLQLTSGKELSRPPLQTSVYQWAQRNEEFKTSFAGEKSFWTETLQKCLEISDSSLLPASTLPSPIGEMQTLGTTLNEEQSHQADYILKTFGARRLESMVMASVLECIQSADSGQSGGVPCAFWYETNGRQLFGEEAADAIGWFTSLFPVYVPESTADLQSRIEHSLSKVPQGGAGFGYLRDELAAAVLPENPNILEQKLPKIRFNFIGAFPSHFNNIRLYLQDNRYTIDARNRHDVLLDVNIIRMEGQWIIQTDAHPDLDGSVFGPLSKILDEKLASAGGRISKEKVVAGQTSLSKTEQQLLSMRPTATDCKNILEDFDLGDSFAVSMVEDILPLTPMQQGMMFLINSTQKIQPGLQQLSLRFSQRLDTAQLKHSCAALLTRHPALRSLFVQQKGIPLQLVIQKANLTFDVRSTEHASGENYLNFEASVRETDLETPFATATQLPVRFTLVLGEDCSTLIISMHHIIYDGWCNAILFRDLSQLYSGAESSEHLYGTSVFRKVLSRFLSQNASSLSYWKNNFAKYEAINWQPISATEQTTTHKNGNGNGNGNGKLNGSASGNNRTLISRNPDSKIKAQLTKKAAKMELTPSALYHAAWGLSLRMFSGHQINSFGTVFSGRSEEELAEQQAIGLFIHTLPFISECSDAITLEELARSHFQTTVEMQEHQSVSLAGLKEISKNTSRELFDSLLVVENYPLNTDGFRLNHPASKHQPAEITGFHFHSEEHARCTLSINYQPEPEYELRFSSEYVSPENAARLMDLFIYSLNALLQNPAMKVSECMEQRRSGLRANHTKKLFSKLEQLKK